MGYGSGAVLTAFCWVLFSLPARSQSCDPEFAGNRTRGQEIAAKFCAACHGADGQGISPQFPNLAAQIPEYLVKQLKAFKVRSDGKPLRPSDVMTPIVAALTEGDFTDVAAYYAKLEPRVGAARDAARLKSVAGSTRRAMRTKVCLPVSPVTALPVPAFARIFRDCQVRARSISTGNSRTGWPFAASRGSS